MASRNLDKAGTQVGERLSHLYFRPLSHPLSSRPVVRMRNVYSSGAWHTAICFCEKRAERKEKGKVENKGKQAREEEREGWGRRGSKRKVSSQTIYC